MASAKLLLVDDDESVRFALQSVLEAHGFEVTAASNVVESLKHIASESFDVLLSDLHMPDPGDGLTVVSAMRHANPKSTTIVLSANPDMGKAAEAIVNQVDDVVAKPIELNSIVSLIRQRLSGERPRQRPRTESVAAILERETAAVTQAWLAQMESCGSVRTVPLAVEERCEHLSDALRDIVFRLRYPQPLGSTTLFSMAALQHGARRRRQGIGAATLVDESRALQIAVFEIIQKHFNQIDRAQLPGTLMAIADEINAQLFQTLSGYENEQPVDVPPWGFR